LAEIRKQLLILFVYQDKSKVGRARIKMNNRAAFDLLPATVHVAASHIFDLDSVGMQ
jgi:hypothetical protein